METYLYVGTFLEVIRKSLSNLVQSPVFNWRKKIIHLEYKKIGKRSLQIVFSFKTQFATQVHIRIFVTDSESIALLEPFEDGTPFRPHLFSRGWLKAGTEKKTEAEKARGWWGRVDGMSIFWSSRAMH